MFYEPDMREYGYESYETYLRSDHWKLVIRAYQRQRCYCCEWTGRDLILCHISLANLTRERADDVITLCAKCEDGIRWMIDRGHPLPEAISLRRKNAPRRPAKTKKRRGR